MGHWKEKFTSYFVTPLLILFLLSQSIFFLSIVTILFYMRVYESGVWRFSSLNHLGILYLQLLKKRDRTKHVRWRNAVGHSGPFTRFIVFIVIPFYTTPPCNRMTRLVKEKGPALLVSAGWNWWG